jgi:hypothetical protein
MKHRRIIISCVVFLSILGFEAMKDTFQIPKTWDIAEIAKITLPRADPSTLVIPVSEDYYYKIPVMKVYKSYPVRLLDSASNKRYIDSLKTLEPVNVFQEPPQSEQDLIRLGEAVFHAPLETFLYKDTFLGIINKDIKDSEIPVANGIFPYYNYIIDDSSKVRLGVFSCAMCHTRVMKGGLTVKGAQGTFPLDRQNGFDAESSLKIVSKVHLKDFTDRLRMPIKALQRAPWISHPSQLELDTINALRIIAYLKAIPPGVAIRHGTNFNQPVSIPDLIGIKDRKYLDMTGSIMHRNIGDLMRYAALNQTMDMLNSYNDFIPGGIDFKLLPEPGKAEFQGTDKRYSDLMLFALGYYLYSLKPPPNPNSFPPEIIKKGKFVFKREGCVTCHTPPLYTNNKLTPVDGFTPPANHYQLYDIFDVSVETNPELALYTRRGTGYYKVPSLLGVWYRGPFGHSGNVATLEDWFDKRRLEDTYVPTGFRPAFLQTMAVKGHEFGLDITTEEKQALIAFLKTL